MLPKAFGIRAQIPQVNIPLIVLHSHMSQYPLLPELIPKHLPINSKSRILIARPKELLILSDELPEHDCAWSVRIDFAALFEEVRRGFGGVEDQDPGFSDGVV